MIIPRVVSHAASAVQRVLAQFRSGDPFRPPTASFTTSFDEDTGEVSVIDQSDGGSLGLAGARWDWAWGDGETSEGQNPGPHTYAVDGTYTITLTLTCAGGWGRAARSVSTVVVTIVKIYLRESQYLVTVPPIDPVYNVKVAPGDFANFAAVLAAYPDVKDYLLNPGADYTGWGATSLGAGGTSARPKTIRYFSPTDDYVHPVRRNNTRQARVDAISSSGGNDWIVQGVWASQPTTEWSLDSAATRVCFDRFLFENGTQSGSTYAIRMRQTTSCTVQRGVVRNPEWANRLSGALPPGDMTGVQIGNVDSVTDARLLDTEIYNYGDACQVTDGPTKTGNLDWKVSGCDFYVEPDFRHCDASGKTIYDHTYDPATYGNRATSENGIDVKAGSSTTDSVLEWTRIWGMRRTYPATSAGDAIVWQRYLRRLNVDAVIVTDGPSGAREEVWPSGGDPSNNANGARDIKVTRLIAADIKKRDASDTGSVLQPVNNTSHDNCWFGRCASITNRTVTTYLAGGPTFGATTANHRSADTAIKNPSSVAGGAPYAESPNVLVSTPTVYAQYERRRWTGTELADLPIGNDPDLTDLLTLPRTPRPDAAFGVANTPGSLSVSLTDASVTNLTGSTLTYDYDWGDGSSHATTQNPSHSYPSRGTYQITQTITRSDGVTRRTWRTVEVTHTASTPAVTVLESSSSTTDGTSVVTGSITPVSGRDYYVAVSSNRSSGSANQPTLSGCGMTWNAVNSQITGGYRVTLFHALADGSSTAGALTASFGGQTQTSFLWHVVEVTGLDPRAEFQQRKTASSNTNVTSASVALLAPLENASNVMLVAMVVSNNTTITGDSDFTTAQVGVSATVQKLAIAYARNQRQCDMTFASSAYAAVAAELRAA